MHASFLFETEPIQMAKTLFPSFISFFGKKTSYTRLSDKIQPHLLSVRFPVTCFTTTKNGVHENYQQKSNDKQISSSNSAILFPLIKASLEFDKDIINMRNAVTIM